MIITVDFETYYDKVFSLSKMTTEEYVRHDDFEVIGVGVKVDDAEAQWFAGTTEEIKSWFRQFDWKKSFVLAHNTAFDGAILSWIFGVRPRGWLDTLCMARAVHGLDAGGSLKALAERYEIGKKGDDVLNALGKRRADFTAEELDNYGAYCKNDADLTYALFDILMDKFPTKELNVVNVTLKMFIEPVLELDLELLEQHLEDVKRKKEKLLEVAAANKDDLMSNPKFAVLLEHLGVDPPRKISLRTGKEAWAFAKTDEDFRALEEHPSVKVQALVAARLGNKTTLEETRTQRFIDIAKRGKLPVPIKYYAAHTGRWGGDDKINLQNLPSRGQNAGRLKAAIKPPEGYVLIDSDSSQIEARTVAWMAGQQDLVEAFSNGEDVYKIMAAAIYRKDPDDVTKEERFVGKTTILGCFGADTKVLTDSGWKRIVEVQTTDMVWDGEEWVKHQGVVPKGVRETITAYGIDATPEHEILTEHGWREWHEVVTNPSLFQSALNKANLPSSTGYNTKKITGVLLGGIQLFDAVVVGKEKLIGTTLRQNEPHDVIRALKAQVTRLAKSIGDMKTLFPTWSIDSGYLTGLQAVSQGATQPLVKHTPTMADGASSCMNLGAQTRKNFYDTSLPSMGGKTQKKTSTVLTTTEGMSLTTYDLQHDLKTHGTSAQRVQCKKKLMTYDLAYAGSRNRFTIATNAGVLIAHNCGYGMGAAKFKLQLKIFGVDIPLDECQRVISIYRQTYSAIPTLWRQAQTCVEAILAKQAVNFGVVNAVTFDATENGFLLPSGLWQRYEGLQKVTDAEGKEQYEYKTRKGFVKIYGGKVVENLCQGVARCVIAEQMVKISKRYKVVLTVHDAVACIAPIEEAKEAQEYVEACMRWRPKWAAALPLNCESGIGDSYGNC